MWNTKPKMFTYTLCMHFENEYLNCKPLVLLIMKYHTHILESWKTTHVIVYIIHIYICILYTRIICIYHYYMHANEHSWHKQMMVELLIVEKLYYTAVRHDVKIAINYLFSLSNTQTKTRRALNIIIMLCNNTRSLS